MIFWKKYSIAFQWVAMDSEAISSSVDTEETVIAQIWIKINDIILEKYDVGRKWINIEKSSNQKHDQNRVSKINLNFSSSIVVLFIFLLEIVLGK